MKTWLIAPLTTLAVALVPGVAGAFTWTPDPSMTFIPILQTNFDPPVASTPELPQFDPAVKATISYEFEVSDAPDTVPGPSALMGLGLLGLGLGSTALRKKQNS